MTKKSSLRPLSSVDFRNSAPGTEPCKAENNESCREATEKKNPDIDEKETPSKKREIETILRNQGKFKMCKE